jgi:dTDP-4-dehydrorhamnose 3,5-epimerase
MKFLSTEIPGVILVEPEVHEDSRGFFLEVYHARKFEEGGIRARFVQDNHSCSRGSILRGLHAQRFHPQEKLVRAIRGEIYDVAVDIRRDSPTYRRFFAARLSARNLRQLFIPAGFAHGFAVLSEEAEVEYKCTDFYRPEDELVIAWNDPSLGIPWPITDPLLSEKDRRAPRLADVEHQLPLPAAR